MPKTSALPSGSQVTTSGDGEGCTRTRWTQKNHFLSFFVVFFRCGVGVGVLLRLSAWKQQRYDLRLESPELAGREDLLGNTFRETFLLKLWLPPLPHSPFQTLLASCRSWTDGQVSFALFFLIYVYLQLSSWVPPPMVSQVKIFCL